MGNHSRHFGALLLKRLNVFFVRQPKALEKPPDRAGGNRYAPLREEPRGHLVERDLASCFHLRAHPVSWGVSLPIPGLP